MSWDADLSVTVDGNELAVGDWNYTHNCSGMAYRACQVLGRDTTTLWKQLDGMSARDADDLLTAILGVFAEAPEMFREMDPENGWGDFDSYSKTLLEMRDASRKFPSGRWEVHG